MTTDSISKQQYGGCNRFLTFYVLAKLVSYSKKKPEIGLWDFCSCHGYQKAHFHMLIKKKKVLFWRLWRKWGFPEASKSWGLLLFFFNRRRISLVIYEKVLERKQIDSGIAQRYPISSFLFQLYTSPLYEKISEVSAHAIGFIDDTIIYVGGRNVDRNPEKLGNVLQICHNWGS